MSSVILWSTDAVAPRHRADYYANALSSALAPMRLERYGEPGSFEASMTMADLGLLAILRQQGSPHRCFRESLDLSRATERTFHLVMCLTSAWNVTHRANERLEPGDAMLFDSAIGADMRIPSSYEIVHVKLAEAWIRQWVPAPGALVGRRIAARSGWGRALTSFMAQLSPQFVAESPLPISVIADHIGALLALSATDTGGTSPKAVQAGERALRTRIEGCIAQRCAEPSLTAEQVGKSIGVSTRTLHRCLAKHQRTFGTLLVNARAELATRMLESPLFRRLTIAEIGRRAGFADASHFARVLRSRTGRTPSRLRAGGARNGPTVADEAEG